MPVARWIALFLRSTFVLLSQSICRVAGVAGEGTCLSLALLLRPGRLPCVGFPLHFCLAVVPLCAHS